MSGNAVAAGRRPSAEDIAWVGLWPAAAVLAVCLLVLAPPLSDLYPSPTYQLFPLWHGEVRPEPLETTRFLFMVAGPFMLAAAVLWLGSAASPQRRFDPLVVAFQAAALFVVAWGAAEQDTGPFVFVPPDYFKPLLLSVPVVVLGLLIGCGLLFVALQSAGTLERWRLTGVDWASTRWTRVVVVVAVLLTALWLVPAVVTDATVADSGFLPSGHIPAMGEDYYSVANGLTPFVDYVPQYVHLLPFAVAPVLTLFDLSLTSYSVAMVALSIAAMLAVFGVLHRVTERPLAALALYVPLLAISFIPWTVDGVQREFDASYYGVFPGRYLGPFVVAWLCALAVRRGRLPAWLPFFVGGLAALNNAEFGAPCVVALVVALALGSDPEESLAARARALVLPAAAGLGSAVLLVIAVVLVRAGELPDFGSLTHYSNVFARQGFGLRPMPTLGLHIAVYATYVAAILTAAVRYVQRRENRTLTAMLAFAGTFGLLTGAYFAGRSWPWQLMLLFPVWGLALALLAWTTFLHLRSRSREGTIDARYFLPSAATMIGFGVMVAAIITFPLPWQQVERLSDAGATVYDRPNEQQFIEEETDPGEAVWILGAAPDHRIAERAGVKNVSPSNGGLSVYAQRDVDRALDALESEGGSKVFFPAVSRKAMPNGVDSPQGAPEHGSVFFESLGESVLPIVAARGYEPVAANPQGDLVLWQR